MIIYLFYYLNARKLFSIQLGKQKENATRHAAYTHIDLLTNVWGSMKKYLLNKINGTIKTMHAETVNRTRSMRLAASFHSVLNKSTLFCFIFSFNNILFVFLIDFNVFFKSLIDSESGWAWVWIGFSLRLWLHVNDCKGDLHAMKNGAVAAALSGCISNSFFINNGIRFVLCPRKCNLNTSTDDATETETSAMLKL